MNAIKTYKIVITVLSILLSASLVLLGVQYVRTVVRSSGTVTVKNNSISSAEQKWEFGGEGLLPGDCLSRDYSVKLNQEEDVSVRFAVSTAKDAKNLAEVLNITVTDLTSGKTVCEGNLGDLAGKEFSESIAHAGQREKLLSYRITVTVDPSAGNAYQNATLEMGFRWSIVPIGQKVGGDT